MGEIQQIGYFAYHVFFVAAQCVVRERDTPHHGQQLTFLVNGGDVINRAGELEQAGCRVYVISGLLGDGGDVFPTERKIFCEQ